MKLKSQPDFLMLNLMLKDRGTKTDVFEELHPALKIQIK
jgi:hypothetical protein